ncbi:hypothetical protein [Thiocystis violacea]|uniref:hypothetical protein n=1 Tax=Thiocystis violacea TaxID=13725 RepID=UPI0019088ADD|nr:hypothetical protein [Thiocystis violacea]MBK1722805.1 hypothetical protein [Thiocystis violacea]
MSGITCRLCGRTDATIRAEELPTARSTGRAHVDCDGHAEYRPVTPAEIKHAEGSTDQTEPTVQAPPLGKYARLREHLRRLEADAVKQRQLIGTDEEESE